LESELSLKQPTLEPNPAKLWFMPYLIVFTTSLALAAGNIYMPSLTLMASNFHTNSNAVLMSVSIYYTGFAALGVIYGGLADYFGRRFTLLCGISIFLTGSIICLFSTELWMFMIGSLIEGIGGASALIVGLAAIQDMYSAEESVKTLAWMGALLSIIPSLSPILGGYLAIAGWQANYLFLTLLGLLLLMLCYRFFVETHTINKNNSGVIKRFFTSYLTVISHSGFLRYASIYPILVIGSTALLTAMPIFIMEKLGYDSKACGYFIGLMTIGYAFGGFVAARLVIQYGIKITLYAGISLSVLGSILLIANFIWLDKYMTFMVGVFVFQSGIAIVHPPSTTIAIRYFSELRASASALRGTFSILGSALGAAVAGLVGGLNMISIANITIVTSLIALLLIVEKQNDNRETSEH